MPQQSLARAYRVNRLTLYGSAVALTLAIVVGTLLVIVEFVTQYCDQQAAVFVTASQQVISEVGNLSARLMQFVDLHEGAWTLREKDVVPLSRYRELLDVRNGVADTDTDLTATPFTIVTSLTARRDASRVAELLLIMRDFSAAPLIDERKVGATLSGYFYAQDGSFTASVPPLTKQQEQEARRKGVQNFNFELISSAERALNGKSVAQLRDDRPLWLAADPASGNQTVSRIVIPLFQGNNRIATLCASVPSQQFLEYFVHQNRPPGFFVLDGIRYQSLISSPGAARDKRIWREIQNSLPAISRTGYHVSRFWHGRVYFITQRVRGPDWVSVYALDGRDILENLRKPIFFSIAAALAVSALLWIAMLYFDRRVIRPAMLRARKLLETEQLNRAIVETSPVGIAVYFPRRQIVALENTVAAQMLGTSNDHATRRFYEELLSCWRDTQSVTGPHRFIEFQWILPDGELTYLGVGISDIVYGGEDAVLFGIVDLSERRANELLLLQARQHADDANRAKSMFLAVASHEIRTPLHGAIGHLELLGHELLQPGQYERIALIKRSFESLLNLVNDILDATKIDSRTLSIDVAPICVNDVVENAAQNVAPVIEGKGLSFYCVTDPCLDWETVLGDDQRLGQILLNLLNNAAKFTHTGTIRISSSMLHSDKRAQWINFTVTDTGIGIPADLQSTIFQPLTQADKTISRRFGGTGLGLYLCHTLVQLMGGRINVRSQPGHGSTFVVDIPFATTGKSPDARQEALAGVCFTVESVDADWRDRFSLRLSSWRGVPQNDQPSDYPRLALRFVDLEGFTPENEADFPEEFSIRMNACGPLVPQQAKSHVHVTSLSRAALLLAIDMALTRAPEVTVEETLRKAPTIELDVIIAEDDPVSLILLENQLQKLGCKRIRVASDGTQALRYWLEKPADILITDLGMPGMDGVALLRAVRELDPDACVLVTTASATAEIEVDGAASFTACMHKPVLLEDLRHILSGLTLQDRSKTAEPHRQNSAPARDLQLEAALLEGFANQWLDESAAISSAISEREVDKVTRLLHRLQGALRCIGADKLAEQLEAIWVVCYREDWISTERQWCRLARDVRAELSKSS